MIEITHRNDSTRVLFTCEAATTMCEAAIAAVNAGANLVDANLAGAKLTGAKLTGANLAGADLAGAYLTGADLARADLAGADLADANLADANLADANLAGADLAGADLAGADLVGANLAGANLARAYLAGAYLTGADLARANLAGAYLTGADLACANLAGAKLTGAKLTGANLAGAKLTGAYLGGLQWIVQGVTRSDGYAFFLQQLSADVEPMIKAGCRYFSVSAAIAHWTATRNGTRLGRESLTIVRHLVELAVIRGKVTPEQSLALLATWKSGEEAANPFHPESPEGRAWERGDRSSVEG